MLLLEQDTIRKRRVDKNNVTKLDVGNNKSGKYKMKTIYNNAVNTRESPSYLSRLYYLIY